MKKMLENIIAYVIFILINWCFCVGLIYTTQIISKLIMGGVKLW